MTKMANFTQKCSSTSINTISWRPTQGAVRRLVDPKPNTTRTSRTPTVCRANPFSASYGGAPQAYRSTMEVPVPDIPQPSTSERKIIFAVDGTQDAEEALRWVSQNIARKGDTIHLVHVMIDPRTPSTAVGSSTAATQWSPARDEQAFSREYFNRLEHEAHTMMSNRFIPSLQFTGIKHEVDLLRLRVHKSAGGIGELISDKAEEIGAELVILASHGAGVLAEYGSVARWCMDNSKTPVMLIPGVLLKKTDTPQPKPNTVIVAATDNVNGLHHSFEFALKHLVRPGDNLYAMHIQQPTTEEAAINMRKQLISDVARWQNESDAPYATTFNVAVDVIAEATSSETLDSAAGDKLIAYAADLNARAVVLYHHGKSMMREFTYGPVTVEVTKGCSRPLVVLGVQEESGGMYASMASM